MPEKGSEKHINMSSSFEYLDELDAWFRSYLILKSRSHERKTITAPSHPHRLRKKPIKFSSGGAHVLVASRHQGGLMVTFANDTP